MLFLASGELDLGLTLNHLNGRRIFDWDNIYQQLLDKGRIWDFRDLYIASVNYGRSDKMLLKFFDSRRKQANPLDTLIGDWSNDAFEESTSLALLDVMAALCLGMEDTDEEEPFVSLRCWLDRTENIVTWIAKTDADLLMTRPYLRWSMAKLGLSTARRFQAEEKQFSSSHPGDFVFDLSPHYLPVYVPKDRERADWTSWALPSHANASLELILNAAKHLGDLDTQSLCYQMLIMRSPEPLNYVKSLIDFQTTTQHDIHGLTNTLLFKYMLCKDKESRKDLRSDIMSIEYWDDFEVSLLWARYTILRALSDPNHSKKWMEVANRLYNDLPIYIRHIINARNPYIYNEAEEKDKQYPKKGKTRIVASYAAKRALADLGYEFYSEVGLNPGGTQREVCLYFEIISDKYEGKPSCRYKGAWGGENRRSPQTERGIQKV